jgi:hypothetical protein
MADREQPYDPYIPTAGQNGAQGAPGQGGNVRTQALQAVCRHLCFPKRSALALPADVVVVRYGPGAGAGVERWHHDMSTTSASPRSLHQPSHAAAASAFCSDSFFPSLLRPFACLLLTPCV